MAEDSVTYGVAGPVATITLNRPNQHNALRGGMVRKVDEALRRATADEAVKVIVIEGAGDSFCAGFDFSGGLEHAPVYREDGYDPGMDVFTASSAYASALPMFMGLWRGLKPTIAKVQGWCLGAGSELALCADLVIASDDARFGTPYSRVWGCHLTGMWVYRLGLAKAKYYALTGDWVSGEEAARVELINESCPLDELDDRVAALAAKLAAIPLTQLAAMKLIVNQAYDNMGLQSTQVLGPILDGVMRNTPEGRAFVRTARDEGVGAAVAARDGPHGDYSAAPMAQRPKMKRRISRQGGPS